MNTKTQGVMFGKASDEWKTPAAVFNALDDEFHFDLDAAATADNALCPNYRGPDHPTPEGRNGLVFKWALSTFVNPPYSKCRAFVAKACEEARAGHTVVMLIPSRTDTRMWHESIWDAEKHQPRPGVEVRFIKGRLKFGGTGRPENSAPFPSVVVIFRPVFAVTSGAD